jgi:hypothetical protein
VYLLAGIAVVVITLLVQKHYAGDDKRLPPISTRKGKESRIVMLPLIVIMFGLIIADLLSKKSDPEEYNRTFFVYLVSMIYGFGVMLWKWHNDSE